MSEYLNATCSICGKKYHVCSSCAEQTSFKPWRSVVDSIEHYKIYTVIHGYVLTKNKENAMEQLKVCNLSDLNSFNEDIKNIIREIMHEEKEEVIVEESKTVIPKNKNRIKTKNVNE